MLTEVIFCLHAIFVAADCMCLPFLTILLMLLAIDIFCALSCIIQLPMDVMVFHYYIHCHCYLESTLYSFIAILYRLLVSLVLVGCS